MGGSGRRSSGRVDLGVVAFVGALVFLAYLAGALSVVSQTPPSHLVADAYKAGKALYASFFTYRDRFRTDLWNKSRREERGVTVLEMSDVQDGFTLYTSGDAAAARLIDLRGELVHEWRRPYSTVWDPSSAVRKPVPDDQVYFRKAMMLPEGGLLALYEGVGDTPYGYGLARLDAKSELVWKNLDNFHHDFDLTPDGRIVGLTHSFRREPVQHADQFDPPLLEDFLAVVDAEGRTVKKISLLDAINESPFRSLLWRVAYYSMEDPLHANAVDYLDRQRAAWLRERIPVAQEGQVLVSFRELAGGSIALVDLEEGQVVWANRGPWLAQHDPDILPGGIIQVFDNRGNLGALTKSRILEVDPATMGIVWSYSGDEEKPLDSPIRASQEKLANGNTLITESSGGRLLEVTADGRIVWEYVNPIRGGEGDAMIPVVSWAQRIPGDFLPPAFLNRIAGTP